MLTPLAVDQGHPFPALRNRSLNLAILLHKERQRVARRSSIIAVVQVPSVLPRLVEVPAEAPHRAAFVLLEDLITMHVGRSVPRLPGGQLQPLPGDPQLRSDHRRGRGRRPAQDHPEGAAPPRPRARRAPGDRRRDARGRAGLPAPGPAPGGRRRLLHPRAAAPVRPGSAVRPRAAARAAGRAVRARRMRRPCATPRTSSGRWPSGTCCCTTPTRPSITWSSSSPRRPTTPTCWPSSRRCTAPTPIRRSSARWCGRRRTASR